MKIPQLNATFIQCDVNNLKVTSNLKMSNEFVGTCNLVQSVRADLRISALSEASDIQVWLRGLSDHVGNDQCDLRK